LGLKFDQKGHFLETVKILEGFGFLDLGRSKRSFFGQFWSFLAGLERGS